MSGEYVKHFILAALIAALAMIFSYRLHTSETLNSMINYSENKINPNHEKISNDYLTLAVNLHMVDPSFAKRPMTTMLVYNLSKYSRLSIGEAFTLVNFTFMYLCSLLMFIFSRMLIKNWLQAHISMILFMFSYSIILAFFPKIYSYDEPLQYIFILLGFISLHYRKWWGYILFFTLALIARESTALLMPSVFFFMAMEKFDLGTVFTKENLKITLWTLAPVLIYVVFLWIYIPYLGMEEIAKAEFKTRLKLYAYNTQTPQFATETLLCWIMAVGLQLYFVYWYVKDTDPDEIDRKYIRSFLLALFLNSAVILITTKARESRLFALPLLFVWPLFGKFVLKEIRWLYGQLNWLKCLKNWVAIMTLVVLLSITHIIANYAYSPTEIDTLINPQDEYLYIMLSVMSVHFSFRLCISRFWNQLT